MKLFFALRLEDGVRNRLEQVCICLQEWGLPAQWVHEADLHITLLYLGEIAEERVQALIHKVDLYLASQMRAPLSVPGLGAFAGKQWPRVIYAAIQDPEAWCSNLHSDLSELCAQRGERVYMPHITLCRPIGNIREHSWQELIEAYAPLLIESLLVKDLVLYQSQPPRDPKNPRYSVRHQWSLIGSSD